MNFSITEALIIQAIVLIFGCGIAYQKLIHIERQLKRFDGLPEKIAKIETELHTLKSKK